MKVNSTELQIECNNLIQIYLGFANNMALNFNLRK